MPNWLKKIKGSLFAALLVSSVHVPTHASTASFSGFYFFGDSLTDMGNNTNKGDTPALNPGGGPTWAKELASKYGFSNDSEKLVNKGNNFAYSGATTKDVMNQIDNLLARNQILDPKALYSVWAGANDLKNAFLKGPEEVREAIISGTANAAHVVGRLNNAGARFILVANLPDLSKTPLGQMTSKEARKRMQEATQNYNQLLLAELEKVDANIIQLDVASFFDYVFTHLSKFGFKDNTLYQCRLDPKKCDDHLFYDFIHPSVAAHRILADYVYATLTAPSYAFALTQAPLSSLRAQNQVIYQQLYPLHLGAGSKPRLFVGGTYTPHYATEYEGASGKVREKGDNYNLTLGFTFPLNERFMGGAALGYTQTTVELTNRPVLGSFDYYSYGLSVFGAYATPQVYVNALLNAGLLDYRKVSRRFNLGPYFTEAKGSTRGKYYGARVDAGYFLVNNARWQTGPVANVDYQRIVVDGYTETSEVGGTAMVFDTQRFDSLITGLGWQVGFKHQVDTTAWLANLSVAVNKQWKGGEQKVRFRIASLNSSKFAYLPIDVPKRMFISIGTNVSATFKERFTVSVGYTANMGERKLSEHFINAGISVALD